MKIRIKKKGFVRLNQLQLENAVIRALGITAQLVITDARELTPVDTGRLRNAWIQKQPTADSITIGNRMEYAPYIEFGTRSIQGKHMLEHSLSRMKEKKYFMKVLKRMLKNEIN